MNSALSDTAEAQAKESFSDANEEDHIEAHTTAYVYEAPVRLWHWVNALCITVLCVTGYFIGNPLPTMPGEAIDNYLMGYIRFAHFAAGYIMAIAFLGRIYWALVGNHHARQIFYIPVWDPKWWSEIIHEIKWYMFLTKEPRKYMGHNPLAHFTMFFAFTLLGLFMIASGFAMYAEGAGQDSWQFAMFGWMIALFPNTQDLHTWHHVGLWVFVIFVMVHIYAAIREDIMSRQSIISTMISGVRMFKDDK